MIKLDVEEYCQNCECFEPVIIEKQQALYSLTERYLSAGDTIVGCEYKNQCKHAVAFAQNT